MIRMQKIQMAQNSLIFFIPFVQIKTSTQRSTYPSIECCVYTNVKCCVELYFPLPSIDCFQLIWCKRVRSSYVICFVFGGAAVRTGNSRHRMTIFSYNCVYFLESLFTVVSIELLFLAKSSPSGLDSFHMLTRITLNSPSIWIWKQSKYWSLEHEWS